MQPVLINPKTVNLHNHGKTREKLLFLCCRKTGARAQTIQVDYLLDFGNVVNQRC